MQVHKKRIEKDDGRFLNYYWFDDEPAPEIDKPAPAEPEIRNPQSAIRNSEPPRV